MCQIYENCAIALPFSISMTFTNVNATWMIHKCCLINNWHSAEGDTTTWSARVKPISDSTQQTGLRVESNVHTQYPLDWGNQGPDPEGNWKPMHDVRFPSVIPRVWEQQGWNIKQLCEYTTKLVLKIKCSENKQSEV